MKRNKTIGELIACMQREEKMRMQLYPKRVEMHKMTTHQMTHELECIKEIKQILGELQAQNQGLVLPRNSYGDGVVERYHIIKNNEPAGLVMVFVNGLLEAIGNISPISQRLDKNKGEWIAKVPGRVSYIASYQLKYKEYLQVIPIPTQQINQKIAAFCKAYKDQFGQTYEVSNQDKRLLKEEKHRNVDTSYLEYYMSESRYPIAGPKTIYDWLMHVNALPQMAAIYATDEDGLPSAFNRKLYVRLSKEDPSTWQKYRTKLQVAGYREVNTPDGKTWVKDNES